MDQSIEERSKGVDERQALMDQHVEHAKHLKAIIDALDPETESDCQLDRIADALNPETPGGVEVIHKKVSEINLKLDKSSAIIGEASTKEK